MRPPRQYATACTPPDASMPPRSELQSLLTTSFGLPHAAAGAGVGEGVGLTTGVGLGAGVADGTGEPAPGSADGAPDGAPTGAGEGLTVAAQADRAKATRRIAAAKPLRPRPWATGAFIGRDPRRRSSETGPLRMG